MKRKDLTEILHSLPIDGSMMDVSNIRLSDKHFHQLIKQGYIHIIEIEAKDIIEVGLTKLGIEWVQHHVDMAKTANIII